MRLWKLRPEHGWRAFATELVIVVLGVLIALGAQQIAEAMSWRFKASQAIDTIKGEVSKLHEYALEWRTVEPCVLAQVDRLRQRLLASGERLEPAPVYSEPGFEYVIRMPNRPWREGAWQAALSDGVTSHFEKGLRSELDSAYTQMRDLVELNSQNNSAYQRLMSLGTPLLLDPGVRLSLLQELAELRGRVELTSFVSGQLIDHWKKAGVLPEGPASRNAVVAGGTYKFCAAQGLPMRQPAEAERPIPN